MNKYRRLRYKELFSLLLIFISLLLILIAGFRPLEYFRDTEIYLEIIHSFDNFTGMEPTVFIINEINLLLFAGMDQSFFLIYAILAVSIKIYAIQRVSLFPLLSIYIYICLYFVLHEMVQIRVGVASAIFLLSISDIKNKKLTSYLFKTLLAVSFHYSSVVMILLYFINPKKINKIIWFSVPLFGLSLSFFPNLMFDILELSKIILPADIANKMNIYLLLINNEDYNKINIFNFFTLSLVGYYYLMLLNIYKFKSDIDILLVKLFGLQLFVYFSFSVIPAVATRVSDFIGVALIITLANFILVFKERIIPVLFVIIWLSGYLYFFSINRLINF